MPPKNADNQAQRHPCRQCVPWESRQLQSMRVHAIVSYGSPLCSCGPMLAKWPNIMAHANGPCEDLHVRMCWPLWACLRGPCDLWGSLGSSPWKHYSHYRIMRANLLNVTCMKWAHTVGSWSNPPCHWRANASHLSKGYIHAMGPCEAVPHTNSILYWPMQ